MEIISPIIHKIQFSILRFAISHIPTKKIPVTKVSTYADHVVNLSKNKYTPTTKAIVAINIIKAINKYEG